MNYINKDDDDDDEIKMTEKRALVLLNIIKKH